MQTEAYLEIYEKLTTEVRDFMSDFEDRHIEALNSLGQEIGSVTMAVALVPMIVTHCRNSSKDPEEILKAYDTVLEALETGIRKGIARGTITEFLDTIVKNCMGKVEDTKKGDEDAH